jgi:hypothetical protein
MSKGIKMNDKGITSLKTLRLTSKILVSITLLSSMAVLPTPTATAAGEVPIAQSVEPVSTLLSREDRQQYQFKAPATGSWNLVGAWNFNNATDQNLSAISYNATCVGANNSSPDDGYGPTSANQAMSSQLLRQILTPTFLPFSCHSSKMSPPPPFAT